MPDFPSSIAAEMHEHSQQNVYVYEMVCVAASKQFQFHKFRSKCLLTLNDVAVKDIRFILTVHHFGWVFKGYFYMFHVLVLCPMMTAQ